MRFSEKDKLRFEEFFQLKDARKYKEGLEILHALKRKYKNNSVIYGLLGTIYYLSKDYKKSSRNFKKVLTLKPKSELASLGFFHSQIEIGNERSALKELKRFLGLYKPKLYTGTINELFQNINNFESKFDRKIINDLYQKWSRYNTIPNVAVKFQPFPLSKKYKR